MVRWVDGGMGRMDIIHRDAPMTTTFTQRKRHKSPKDFQPFFDLVPRKARREADILFGLIRLLRLLNCFPSIACRTLGHGCPLEFSQAIPVGPIRGHLRTLGSSRRSTRYPGTELHTCERRPGGWEASRGPSPTGILTLTQTPALGASGQRKTSACSILSPPGLIERSTVLSNVSKFELTMVQTERHAGGSRQRLRRVTISPAPYLVTWELLLMWLPIFRSPREPFSHPCRTPK